MLAKTTCKQKRNCINSIERDYYCNINLLLLLIFIPFNHSSALEQISSPTGTSAFFYILDSSFQWHDQIQNPTAKKHESTNNFEQTYAPEAKRGYSSLSLKKLAFHLFWNQNNQYRISLELRPDFNNIRNSNHSDFDSRLGPSYRQLPKVDLLNYVQIENQLSPQTSFSFGTMKSAEPKQGQKDKIETLLDFGLETKFPEKFMGARISHNLETPFDLMIKRQKYSLILLSGHDEQNNTMYPAKNRFDHTPLKRHPYYGVAATGSIDYQSIANATLIIGTLDRFSDIVTQEGDAIKTAEVFAGLNLNYYFGAKEKNLLMNWNLKYSKESFHYKSFEIPSLTQISLQGKIILSLWQEHRMFFGIGFGKSERLEQKNGTANQQTSQGTAQGSVLDLGWSRTINENLSAQLQFSEEKRIYRNQNDQEQNGIQNTANSKKRVRRCAIGINYILAT